MTSLLLRLIIAHLAGDFVLQPQKWVKEKSKKNPVYFLFHFLVHFFALGLFLNFQQQYFIPSLILASFHIVIDYLKESIKTSSSLLVFLADQAVHLLSLIILALWYYPLQVKFGTIMWQDQTLIWIGAIIICTFVGGVLIRVLTQHWVEHIPKDDSLKNAGWYIGMLERLFIFGFITLNHWEGIGLLLTAKSVFRYGDINQAKDRKLTEYILIGTLLSFGIGMLCGAVYLKLIKK